MWKQVLAVVLLLMIAPVATARGFENPLTGVGEWFQSVLVMMTGGGTGTGSGGSGSGGSGTGGEGGAFSAPQGDDEYGGHIVPNGEPEASALIVPGGCPEMSGSSDPWG